MPNVSADVSSGAPRLSTYADNGDGTITDGVTGLVWQKTPPGTYVNPAGAASYCVGLSLGGHTDWRLPTIIELTSIVDYATTNPALDQAFPSVSGYFWSATTSAAAPTTSWAANFDDGELAVWTNLALTRCVR
jgi:hypothetical protein